MSGDARNYSHRGIIPRALQHVFRDVDMRTDRIYSMSVSYLEIYNESLRDLLSDDPAASDSLAILDDAANTVVRMSCSSCGCSRKQTWLCMSAFVWPYAVTADCASTLFLDQHTCPARWFASRMVALFSVPVRMLGVLQVRGLTKVPVSSEEEALRQFFLGEQARSTAQHALNSSSSRSHVLFTLHIEMRASAEAEERALLSKLHLVDLAGEDSRCWMAAAFPS